MNELKYLKIGSDVNNMFEIKQLWYGLEEKTNLSEKDYNEVYNGYVCENQLNYVTEPSRDIQGTLHNDDIETFYIPTATFNISYINADVFSKLIQIINSKGFYIEYYDYEIMEDVIRQVYMTTKSLEKIHNIGKNLKGFINLELTFVSKVGYASYEALKKKIIPSESSIQVIIDNVKPNSSAINEITTEEELNNISLFRSGKYNETKLDNEGFVGKNVFLLGSSKLNENAVMSNNYNGIISRKSSNDNGDFETPFNIKITGTQQIKNLRICFDKEVNEYATSMTINNQLVYNNNYIFEHLDTTEYTEVNISFLSWNKANRPLRISFIVVNDRIVFNHTSGLIEVIRGSQTTNDNTMPEYSCILGYSSFKVRQQNRNVENYINSSSLNEKKVEILYKDNLIGTFLTNDYNIYDNDVSFELQDYNIKIDSIKVNACEVNNIYEYWIFISNYLKENSINLEENFISVITNKIIKYKNDTPDFKYEVEQCSLREALNKICQALLIRIFTDENGNLKVGED